MTGDMKGVSTTWYEICNADGHALILEQENRFRSEDQAAEVAARVCVDYRDTVTVKEHTSTILRIFHAEINAVEV